MTTTAAGGVTWEVVDDSELQPAEGADSQPRRKLRITIPKWCGKWVVGMDSFADGVVGAKSKNLAGAVLPVIQLAATQMIDHIQQYSTAILSCRIRERESCNRQPLFESYRRTLGCPSIRLQGLSVLHASCSLRFHSTRQSGALWQSPSAMNCCAAGLRGKLSSYINLPPSVTVPFGSFEEALKQGPNKEIAKKLEVAIKDIPTTGAEEKLQIVRDIVMEVQSSHGMGPVASCFWNQSIAPYILEAGSPVVQEPSCSLMMCRCKCLMH